MSVDVWLYEMFKYMMDRRGSMFNYHLAALNAGVGKELCSTKSKGSIYLWMRLICVFSLLRTETRPPGQWMTALSEKAISGSGRTAGFLDESGNARPADAHSACVP